MKFDDRDAAPDRRRINYNPFCLIKSSVRLSVAMILVDLRTSLAREDSVFMNTPLEVLTRSDPYKL